MRLAIVGKVFESDRIRFEAKHPFKTTRQLYRVISDIASDIEHGAVFAAGEQMHQKSDDVAVKTEVEEQVPADHVVGIDQYVSAVGFENNIPGNAGISTCQAGDGLLVDDRRNQPGQVDSAHQLDHTGNGAL